MKFNHLIHLFVASGLASQTVLPASAQVPSQEKSQKASSLRSEIAAITETQKLSLNLLIALTILDQKGYELAAADANIVKKYENIRRSYLGAAPTSIAGSAASYTGRESLKTVDSVIAPLTTLMRLLYKGSVYGSEQLGHILTLLKFDVLVKQSAISSEKVWTNVMLPIIKTLVTKNTAISSGSVSATGLFVGSVGFMMNDAKDALSLASVRQLLGQDDVVRARIEKAVDSVSPIFELDSSAKDSLKIAIYDDIIAQAVKNQFSQDSTLYKLDVLEIMKKRNLVSADVAKAVETLRTLAANIAVDGTQPTREDIEKSVDSSLALAAVIEQQLNSKTIKDSKVAAEMQRILGGVTARLALIGFNLKR